ncbi:MAG: sulfate permease [Chlamydiae bacterium]|nr:sulfate permease [Chlamydiota bacterium]
MHSKWDEFIPKLFHCFQENYGLNSFRKDFVSGTTVAVLALPLAMAIGIASGVSPDRGLYTAIIAGFLISFLGGSRFQIGGPTAAFVAIVYGIVERQGYEGLVFATLTAGIILILMGISRLGSYIKYIPFPLVTGLTAAIALTLFSTQVKDFFGLKIVSVPSDFLGKWHAYFSAMPTLNITTLAVALSTLGLIIGFRRFFPKLPWAILSIGIVTFFCFFFHIPVETVSDRFGEIKMAIPTPALPKLSFNLDLVRRLFPDAFAVALLAGLESLVSAVIADGLTGDRHKSNCELVAQGIANIGSAFFGGIPATAALARTATNIRSGAVSPVSGMIHAVIILLILLLLAPFVGFIPLASLSAILVMIAWNMSQLDHVRKLFRAPLGDVVVLVSAFFLTLLIDLTVAVEVGVILATFLFMKRMSDVANVTQVGSLFEKLAEKDDPDAISKKIVPPGVEVYEIDGPFFFGSTDKLKDVIHHIKTTSKIFILRMRKVSTIDASGMNALHELHLHCKKRNIQLILSGVREDLLRPITKYGLKELIGGENIFPHIDAALERARGIVDPQPNITDAQEKT